ncbi:MAG: hypothetical protein EOS04_14160 [Mesorhizobium sp.]|nr:MAG: hypothetical protein EOR98_19680 [Mesorhizobium sp.]RWN73839.1 MAG: hypothetical protein EOS02_23375 [Mesorhizobium sp.]RWN76983.1 MAG: hypothetical protein EOS01_19605 [Mesorhizobium sp.]RWN88158.1 MAG: hypothetical protein EOS04_14160 [Mesorhizobium sp.]RWO12537.1 MAG: hypothetical protein EOS15_20960 [Mesorhizobium sp.]
MPEVTRRTLLAFTAVASVVEPRLVKGKLPDANAGGSVVSDGSRMRQAVADRACAKRQPKVQGRCK